MSKKPSVAALKAGWEKAGYGLDWEAAVRIMGWKVGFMPPAYDGHFGWEAYWEGPSMLDGGLWTGWRPSEKGDHLQALRLRTREAGKGALYAMALMNELEIPLSSQDALSAVLAVAYAPPEKHLRAMLAAWGWEE